MKANSPMPETVSDKICVLYDPSDGRIVHTHRSTTLASGKIKSDEEIEARAREIATEAGHDVKALHILHLAPEAYDASKMLVVDGT